MQTLFAISILCFIGILWAALALARRIKIRTLSPEPTHADFKHHILSITPISPLPPVGITPQLVDPIPVAPPQAEDFPNVFVAARPAPEPAPAEQRPRISGLNQSVHDIAANKQWILPPHPIRTMRLPLHRIGRSRKVDEPTRPLVASRKPPQPASRSGVVHRLDPAYFNKDLGDLTDPYQPPPGLIANHPGRRD